MKLLNTNLIFLTIIIFLPILACKFRIINWNKIHERSIKVNANKTSSNTTIFVGARIVGGFHVKNQSSFPYQVALVISLDNEQTGICGGCLISNKTILTAAHCVVNALSALVIMGARDITKEEKSQVRMKSSKFIIHNKWNDSEILNDIALVILPRPVTFNEHISPARLPTRTMAQSNLNGVQCTIAGWGKTSDNDVGAYKTLRWLRVPFISNTACQKIYPEYITPANICTSGVGKKSTCNGDSGGPCVITGVRGSQIVVGITSFGDLICDTTNPSVYTRITSFLDWIQKHTGIPIQK